MLLRSRSESTFQFTALALNKPFSFFFSSSSSSFSSLCGAPPLSLLLAHNHLFPRVHARWSGPLRSAVAEGAPAEGKSRWAETCFPSESASFLSATREYSLPQRSRRRPGHHRVSRGTAQNGVALGGRGGAGAGGWPRVQRPSSRTYRPPSARCPNAAACSRASAAACSRAKTCFPSARNAVKSATRGRQGRPQK